MRTIRILMTVAVWVSLTIGTNGFAKETAKTNPFKATLRTVKPLDLPAQCARLVVGAAKKEQQATTVAVIDASVMVNPAATPAVVGAIAKAVPGMAAIAAARAATLQPKLAATVTRAAAAAAPKEAGRIVYSVCRALPYAYKTVAISAANTVPAAGSEILGAVTLAIPSLKPAIIQAAPNSPDVATALRQTSVPATGKPAPTSTLLAATMPVMPPPRVGLPFVPLSGQPQETTPADSGEVPPGGRDYARP